MSNYQFLQTYVALQKDIMFDELVDLGFGLVCHSHADSSSFWNNALVNTDLDDDQIRTIETLMVSQKRKPAVYFENRADLDGLAKRLKRLGYT